MAADLSPGSGIIPHPREVARAVKKSTLVEPFLCCRYSFCPYMACGHGCAYCDGRAEKYWVEGNYERDIVVRTNLAGLLGSELSRLRERAPVAVGSGISDAYQPIEETQRLMRDCAQELAAANLPVTVLTKSALVRRDIDLWERIHRRSTFILNLSIATLDEQVRRTFEPGASSIEERLQTIREFSQKGIPVGVMAMPLLPLIGDSEADIRSLVQELSALGVAFVMAGGLTLRPGRQKDFFMARLEAAHPALVPEYERIYGEQRPSSAPLRSYSDDLAARIARVLQEAGMPALLPHALFRGRLPIYDEVHLLLQHMTELYAARGIRVASLKSSARRYGDWLAARKAVFNRRRSIRQQDLEEDARMLFFQGADDVLGNEKLAAFLRSVVVDRKLLDYRSLTLSDPPVSA